MKTHQFAFLPIVLALAACDPKSSATDAAAQAAEGAAVVTPIVLASAADLIKGADIYNANCVGCHSTGVRGAPRLGAKTAWQPSLAKGSTALYNNALHGIRLMPAKGGNRALKDDEVKAAVDFMLSKVI